MDDMREPVFSGLIGKRAFCRLVIDATLRRFARA
jgi:hypothetical protein